MKPIIITGKRTSEDIIREYFEREYLKIQENEKPGETGSGNLTVNFSLEDLTGSYRITGIQYRNGIYTVNLFKELLPRQTQDKHAEHRKQVIADNTNEFYTPSYPEFHSVISTMEQNKDNSQYKDKIEEVRQFLKQQILDRWLMTLTRIQYNPENQKDKVIHNYNQQDSYKIELDSFIGPDGYITDQNVTNVIIPLQALLDTKQSLQEINSIYKWLTDGNAYIWRLNSEVSRTTESVARIVAGSDRVGFDCDGHINLSYASLGIRAKKIHEFRDLEKFNFI